MAFGKRAPQNLPRAVSDLVAEGGNVLALDDKPVSRRERGAGSDTPPALEPVGPRIARVVTS